jgi:hypothetical protein
MNLVSLESIIGLTAMDHSSSKKLDIILYPACGFRLTDA